MPRVVAGAAIFLGAGVIAFAFAVPTLSTSSEDPVQGHDEPRVTLSPVRSSDPRSSDEVNGVVRAAPGTDVSGLRVDLVPLFSDEDAKRRTTTDRSGRFSFEDVDVTPGTPYAADVRFQDVTFPSEVLRFGTTPQNPVVVVVAPPTRSTSVIGLDVESVAVVGDAKGAQVVHALTVRNRSKLAYVGALRLPLIEGGNAIDPRAGLDRRLLDLGNGEIVSRAPLVPGRHDITYTYVSPMPRDGLSVRRTATHPTKRFELLVGGELTAARPGKPTPAEIVTIGPEGRERQYTRIKVSNLAPQQTVRFIVSVKPASNTLRSVGLVAAALVAVAIFAFPFVRRRHRAKQPPSPQPVYVE
ncbi:MAG TPA: hypothetical protein VFA34_14170 [Actinomycetota bacterium]|jgi:hypothetical protein|nr:hypothetical protein [Actinomycetota bacterium]